MTCPEDYRRAYELLDAEGMTEGLLPPEMFEQDDDVSEASLRALSARLSWRYPDPSDPPFEDDRNLSDDEALK